MMLAIEQTTICKRTLHWIGIADWTRKGTIFLLATHLYSQKGCAIETTVARTIITFSIELMVLMAVV